METRELVEKHLETFNGHDAAGWARGYAEDAVLTDPQYPEPLRGRAAIQKDIEDFYRAFPDARFRTTTLLASEREAAVQGVCSGTHTGVMEGPTGTIQPTNKPMELSFAAFVRTNDEGLITEERRHYDLAGMMTQLGLTATPERLTGS